MTDNRRPRIWARVPPEEHEQAEKAAEKHYGGNLSMLVRVAVQKWIVQLSDNPTDDDKKEPVAA